MLCVGSFQILILICIIMFLEGFMLIGIFCLLFSLLVVIFRSYFLLTCFLFALIDFVSFCVVVVILFSFHF